MRCYRALLAKGRQSNTKSTSLKSTMYLDLSSNKQNWHCNQAISTWGSTIDVAWFFDMDICNPICRTPPYQQPYCKGRKGYRKDQSFQCVKQYLKCTIFQSCNPNKEWHVHCKQLNHWKANFFEILYLGKTLPNITYQYKVEETG